MTGPKRWIASLVSITLTAQQAATAQTPPSELVNRAELRQALVSNAARRETSLRRVRHLLEQAALEADGKHLAELTRVSRALAALDDRTLERLALQSDEINERLRGEGTGKVLLIVFLVLIITSIIVSASLPESS